MTDEVQNPVIPSETEAVQVDHNDFWQQQYEEAVSGGGNNFLFFKKETTRIRLIGVGDNPHNWVRAVDNEYRGTVTKKYLVLGYDLGLSGQTSQHEPVLQAVVFTKGAWGLISNMMLQGWDLFTAEGVGLTVNRQDQGGRVTYAVLPAPTKVAINPEMLAAAQEASWDFYLKQYEEMQTKRGDNKNSSPSVADAIVNAAQPGSTDW